MPKLSEETSKQLFRQMVNDRRFHVATWGVGLTAFVLVAMIAIVMFLFAHCELPTS